MKREELLIKIQDLLAILTEKINIANSNKEFNINIHAENIFIKILNIVYNLDLKNANYEKLSNYPGIDLFDNMNKVAIQVTSTSSKTKINETLKKFIKNNLEKEYDTLYIYLLKNKLNYNQQQLDNISDGKITFNIGNHIINKEDIYKELNRINDLEIIEKVLNILEDEFQRINTPEYQHLNIGISFADGDIEFVKNVIIELQKYNITIYSDSDKLKYDKGIDNTRIKYIHKSIPKNIDFFIVIISEEFKKNKWTNYYKCPILNTAIKQQDIIFNYKISYETESIDELLNKSNVIENTTFTENQYLLLVNSFIEKTSKILKSNSYKINGYRDTKTILDNFQGGGFVLIDEEKKSIGYELYHKKTPGFDTDQYVLYLYDKINQTKTKKFISDKHKDLFKDKNLFILTKKPKLSDPNERIKNIKDKFKVKNVFFVDEFIWKYCTSDDFKHTIPEYNISFVEPFLKSEDNEQFEFDYIEDWLVSDNPILVLKGAGGIGKTTVAKSISNLVYKKFPFSNVVFINSQQIVEELIKLSQQNERIDLYKFYVANHESLYSDTEKLNFDLFRLNIDNGNILLIIDGLDEVISKLWNYFDINDFFQSIFDYTKEIGNGKILITCRSYFWDKSNPDKEKFDSLEILPFNEEKAKLYFRNHYPNSDKLVIKGLNIAKKLIGNQKNNEYVPFVLDQVKIILEDKLEGEKLDDPSFNSNLLIQSILNDYIIFKICQREIIRVEQIEVDEQIKAFINLAISKEFNLEDNTIIIDKFKAHPLVVVENNHIMFKYDFFESHFKNIYLSLLIKDENRDINIEHIRILANYVRYGSAFVDDICERIPTLTEDVKTRFALLIEEINNFDKNEANNKLKNKAISGLFLIALRKLHTDNNFDITVNTNLLKELFLDNNIVKLLSIVNLTSSDNKKILFDFSNLKFENCTFINYEFFWQCKFNSKTYFSKCSFFDLNNKSGIKTQAKTSNFNIQTCNKDKYFLDVLEKTNSHINNTKQKVLVDLRNFLNIFLKGGYLKQMPIEKVNASHIRKRIKTKDMIKILSKSIIETYNYPKSSSNVFIRVKKEYSEDVVKFLTDATMEQSIKKAISDLLE